MTSEQFETYMEMTSEVEQEGFSVKDQQTAEWVVRRIAESRKRQNEIDELYQAEMFRLKTWKEKEMQKEQSNIEYFETVLKPWAQEQGKSVSLPSGKVRFRKMQDKFIYDDQMVIAWAKQHLPEAIRVKEELEKKAIKDHVKATGELPDGLSIEQQEPKFEVVTE